MKGVPIKFRGKRIKDGKMIYGDLEHYFKDVCIRYEDKDEPLTYFIDKVVKDSIAQLCGYDAEGNEVYEGDKLILGSHEYIAGIRPVSYTDDKKYYKPEKNFSDFLLKEV